ncbi:MAG: hypothetical protein FJW31_01860 [Acidobacteria bacterium]|nr:hypothetical protein [Acidobacteriota bacterium]
MSGLYSKYRSQGLEVLMAGMDVNPLVPEFIKRFNVNFPVGVIRDTVAREFMQLPVMVRASVPWKAIIDKNGVVRAQFTGEQAHFYSEERETAQWADRLLAEKPAPAPGPRPRATKK